ncbi:MAG TPA: cadherin domain-containing protein, partial [Accumulibacter sp.]|nr:cadherin domain-containing protein [Accumulibacter sp.]HNE11957.1 cadherin domain-containing protein [Accumulibacter sp.]HNM76530.1 cadherin domain-containing protein [Accumulibacter sp.]HNO58170.1 cadherin domain-containing protein [Accumulibacter sp.]
DAPTGSVTIDDTTPTQGQTLTASNSLADVDGLGAISYQWQRGGVDIAGATGATYTTTQADVGATLSVLASYTDGQGTVENVTSASVGPVISSNHNPQITSHGGATTVVLTHPENVVLVTTITATDPDLPADSLTFSLNGGSDQSLFGIDPASGELVYLTAPDYENPSDSNGDGIYEVNVLVSDGHGGTAQQQILIHVGNVNESGVSGLVDVDPAANQVQENSLAGTTVGIQLQASDPDSADTITFSLDNDAGGRFVVASTTGVLTVAEGVSLDREAASSYTVVVRASSTDGSYLTRTFVIDLLDSNEFQTGPIANVAPSASQNQALMASSSNGTMVGIQAQAHDADATHNQITYSLTNDAGGAFAIDAATGMVTVADATHLMTANSASLDIVVKATSEDGSSQTRGFTIQITLPQTPTGNNTGNNTGTGTSTIEIINNGASSGTSSGSNSTAGGSGSTSTSNSSSGTSNGSGSSSTSTSGNTSTGGTGTSSGESVKPSATPASSKSNDVSVVQPTSTANNPVAMDNTAASSAQMAFEVPQAVKVQNISQTLVSHAVALVGSQEYKLYSVAMNQVAISDVTASMVSQTTFSKSTSKVQNIPTTDLSFAIQSHTTTESLTSSVQVNSTKMVGVSLSVGVAWWALRAGGLLASLAASLPTWRGIDTLMILRDREEGDDWGNDPDENNRRRQKMLPDRPPVSDEETT